MITNKFKVNENFLLNNDILESEKLLDGYYSIFNNEMVTGIRNTEYIFVGIFSNEENLTLFKLKYDLIESN